MTTAVATPVSITHFPPADVYAGEINTEMHGIPRIFNAGLSANPEDSAPYTFSNGVVVRTNCLYCAVQNDRSCFFQTFEANPTHPLCCAPTGADQNMKSKCMIRYTAIALKCAINPLSELAQKVALAQAPGLMGRRTALIQGATQITDVLCPVISGYAHESPAAIAHDCMLDILMSAEPASARANSLLKANTSGMIIQLLNANNSLLTDRLIRWPLSQQTQASSSGSAGSAGAAAAATSTSSMPFQHLRRGCILFNEDLNVLNMDGDAGFVERDLPPGARAPAAATAAAGAGAGGAAAAAST